MLSRATNCLFAAICECALDACSMATRLVGRLTSRHTRPQRPTNLSSRHPAGRPLGMGHISAFSSTLRLSLISTGKGRLFRCDADCLYRLCVDVTCSTYAVTSLWLYRNWGVCNLNISIGLTPFDQAKKWTWSVGGQGWISYPSPSSSLFSPPVTARYVTVTALGQTGGSFLEMVVYGTLTTAASQQNTGTAPAAPRLGLLLGLSTPTGTNTTLAAGVTGAIREKQVRLVCVCVC